MEFLENDWQSSVQDDIVFEDVAFEAQATTKMDPEKSTVLYDELTLLFRETANKNIRRVIQFIATYIDKNSEGLSSTGPANNVYFDDKVHGEELFKILGVNKNEVTNIIRKCPLIEKSFRTLNNPLFFLLETLIHVYTENAKVPLWLEAKTLCMMFLAIRFYSSRVGYLLRYGVNQAVMDYTINNLDNKYIFKQYGSVYAVLKHCADQNDDTVGERIRSDHLDSNFKYYITNISTKINNTLGNIMDQYMTNYKQKNYLNEDSERWNDEDQTIKELSNTSAIIINLAERVYNKMRAAPVDESILRDACNQTKIKVNSVHSTMEEIIDSETKQLREMITCILQLYFLDSTKHTADKVKSRYFYTIAMNIYKVSNSKSPQIIRIKQILDDWIQRYGSKYVRLAREATLINFRKAVYIYIVGSIVKYA